MLKLKLINKPSLLKLKCNLEFPEIVLANLQEKTIVPKKEKQEVVADIPYDGLSKVTVQEIPTQYIIPSGNIQITENGTYDVRVIENAIVEIPEKKLGTKTITENGTYNATNDNLDGYNQVSVETSGVDISEYISEIPESYSSYNNVGVWYTCIKKLPSIVHEQANKYNFFRMFDGEELDTLNFTFPKNTSMQQFCYSCYKLKKINISNMISSNIKTTTSMFAYCRKLETIIFPDDIGTNFASADISQMFRATGLKNIPLINASNVTNPYWVLYDSNEVENLGGFRNLGQAYETSVPANYNTYTLDLSFCPKLTEQSIINVLNNLYDIATKGCNTQSVVLGSTNLAKLTSEAGQQALTNAQNRGWSVS